MMARVVTAFLALILSSSLALAKPDVTDVRIGVHPDKTRFVLELTEEPAYRAFTLPDPFRVVIDLPALEWRLGTRRAVEGGGLVQALRYGLFAPGTSRVVLDVGQPVDFDKVFTLPPENGYGYRLVIDLKTISREAYFARARTPLVSSIPLPRAQQAAVPVAPPKPKGDTRPVIVIDAGHGGVDPGAIGQTGIYEKDLVLTFAKELQRMIEAGGRYRVHMTRDSDVFVRLRDRVRYAQDSDAGLFISLHANAHRKHDLRGAAIYTLSENASDAEAAALAAKENKADAIAGIDLSDQPEVVSKILIDLAQRETMNQSKRFANILVDQLRTVGPVVRNTHRSAGFAVLKSPTVPSVLVEVGYLSNKAEEKLLRSEDYRNHINQAIIKAIDGYFEWQRTAGPS
jgi:N-acetylmuramoyl-L-alanine amidase